MQFLVELLHKKKELAVTPDMKLNVFRQVLILVHSDDKKLIVAMFLHFVSSNRSAEQLHLYIELHQLCMYIGYNLCLCMQHR